MLPRGIARRPRRPVSRSVLPVICSPPALPHAHEGKHEPPGAPIDSRRLLRSLSALALIYVECVGCALSAQSTTMESASHREPALIAGQLRLNRLSPRAAEILRQQGTAVSAAVKAGIFDTLRSFIVYRSSGSALELATRSEAIGIVCWFGLPDGPGDPFPGTTELLRGIMLTVDVPSLRSNALFSLSHQPDTARFVAILRSAASRRDRLAWNAVHHLWWNRGERGRAALREIFRERAPYRTTMRDANSSSSRERRAGGNDTVGLRGDCHAEPWSIPRARITLRVQQRCTSARSIADCSANHSAPVGRFSPNSGFRADFPTSCAASRVVPRAELGGLADSFLVIALARPTRNVSDDTPSRAAQALVLSALGVVGSKRGSPYQGGFERLSRIARDGADNSARTTAMIRLCWMPDTASVFSVF